MVSVCVWKNTNKKGPITIPLTVHFLFNKITWLAAVKQCLVNNYLLLSPGVIYHNMLNYSLGYKVCPGINASFLW